MVFEQVAHHEDAMLFLSQFVQGHSIRHRQRHRLFDQDVFPRGERTVGNIKVRRCDGGDDNAIQRGVLQKIVPGVTWSAPGGTAGEHVAEVRSLRSHTQRRSTSGCAARVRTQLMPQLPAPMIPMAVMACLPPKRFQATSRNGAFSSRSRQRTFPGDTSR